jgi:hypothetical protein
MSAVVCAKEQTALLQRKVNQIAYGDSGYDAETGRLAFFDAIETQFDMGRRIQ